MFPEEETTKFIKDADLFESLQRASASSKKKIFDFLEEQVIKDVDQNIKFDSDY